MTVAILITAENELQLYAKQPRDRFRRQRTLRSPADLREWLRWNLRLDLFASAGAVVAPDYLDIILERVDVVTIPEAWLYPIPPHATAQRAQRAAEIARAHRRAPIHTQYALEPPGNPSSSGSPF